MANRCANRDGMILYHYMGTGKTFTSIAIAVNLPSIYFSTQDKVRDFSYRNGFTDYNVDILDAEWHTKLNEKIDRLKTDKEYLQNWYEIRDKSVIQYTKDFYDFCHKIKDLL